MRVGAFLGDGFPDDGDSAFAGVVGVAVSVGLVVAVDMTIVGACFELPPAGDEG